jgi:transposase
MGNGSTIFVGLDVHKDAINVAMLRALDGQPVEWQLANEQAAVRRFIRQLEREADGAEVRCFYEAGPCGYALKRELDKTDIVCEVVAPALIPVKPGDRVKTDRRDARKLAELARAGLLTEVIPPTEDQEAVRDLCRARLDAQQDLVRCRHRLSKLLLRRGLRHSGRAWTDSHRRWLRGLTFERHAERVVFADYLLAVEQLEARLQSFDEELTRVSQEEAYREPVGRLRCFRGIDTVTAMVILSELHDIRRFASPRQLMAFAGLVPSEYSSGGNQRRGSITKTGNAHLRRVLVESSWHYRHRPSVGTKLRKRREGQPAAAIGIAEKAQHRLHRRFERLVARSKPANKAVVAVARELAGFVWAALSLAPGLGTAERNRTSSSAVAHRRSTAEVGP